MSRVFILVTTLFYAAHAGMDDCEPQHGDGIKYAADLARSVNHFMKHCARDLHCVKSLPSMKTVTEFFDRACDFANNCIKTLKTSNVQVLHKCLKNHLWSVYNGSGVLPHKEMLCIEAAADCGVKQVRSVQVAKLQVSYLRRLFG
ncbi:uncharacterized protein LOC142817396 [Rhipicephalus microplus]|uniref:uncharacterized protein LOC142817396 n=1 Tax=Rhipicephalus microplus TaxID=6941 RepID=UPI003F6D35AB